jgi:hypothetical protein
VADKYVKSTGSATAPYDTWAKAATTIETAVEAAAAGERVFVDSAHTDTIVADLVIATTAAGVQVISTSDTATEPPATYAAGATITGSATSGVDIDIRGGSWFGFTFIPSNTTLGGGLRLSSVDDKATYLESCTFNAGTISTNFITLGTNSAANVLVETRNCSFVWGHASQDLNVQGPWRDIGSDLGAGAATPSPLMAMAQGPDIELYGSDLSDFTTPFAAGTSPYYARLYGCKLHASFSPPSFTVDASGEIWMYDCASGDEHFRLRHYNYRGNTTSTATGAIPSTDAGTYDGTNAHSLVVIANAAATIGKPYQTPWSSVYHAGTSAITPRLEILRDDSTSAYTDGEVWAEWLYKGTSGSTRYSFVSDRRGVLTAAANQADGAGLGAWANESGTAKSMKLTPTSAITPAEIGSLMVRVCITANLGVNVNLKILDLGRTESNVERIIGGDLVNTNVTTGGGSGGGLKLVGCGGLAG